MTRENKHAFHYGSGRFYIFCFVLVFCTFSTHLFAQNASDISNKQSLSKRPVISVFQDSLGFLWFASPLVLHRYDGKNVLTYSNQPGSEFSLSEDNLSAIYPVKDGGVLVRYQNNLSFVDWLQQGDRKAKPIFFNTKSNVSGNIKDLFVGPFGDMYLLSELEDQQLIYKGKAGSSFQLMAKRDYKKDVKSWNRIIIQADSVCWMLSDDANLCKWNLETGLISYSDLKDHFPNRFDAEKIKAQIFQSDKAGNIWMSFKDKPGLFYCDVIDERLKTFEGLDQSKYYFRLWEDNQGLKIICEGRSIWDSHGLYIWKQREQVRDISELLKTYNKVDYIFGNDFSDMMFLGTYVGLKKLVFKSSHIKTYLDQRLDENQWGYSIRGLVEMDDGSIYIAREQACWYRLDPQKQQLDTFAFSDDKSYGHLGLRNSFSLIDGKDGYLWGSRRGNGEDYYLIRFDPLAQTFTSFPVPVFIQSITQTSDGLIWLGCGSGRSKGVLMFFDKSTATFKTFKDKSGNNPFEHTEIRYIIEGSNGKLCLGTTGGLFIVDVTSKSFIHFGKAHGLSNENIVFILEDESGRFWLGTQGGGINILDTESGSVKIYDQKDGLSDNLVSGILADNEGNYWISTFDGLSYLDIKKETFRTFYKNAGLSHNEFNRFSMLKGRDGRMYFGGMNGLNSFDPKTLLSLQESPKLTLSSISRYNLRKDSLIVETKDLFDKSELQISPYDAYFQLDFFLPDFKSPDQNRYRYRLEGYDNDWNDLGNSNFVRYYKLKPGQYQLYVQGAVPGGQWEEGITMDIQVNEVFYKTKWAIAFYVLLLTSMFFLISKFRMRRKLEKAEAQRLKELNDFKSNFYANISHELRTPLTLISGPLENTLDQFDKLEREELLTDLRLASRNSKRLLYLINRLLDLSKLEAGKWQLNYEQGDIIAFLKYLTESFHSLAQNKNISLSFYHEIESSTQVYDAEKLSHILYNLLSNAIKFTPENGKVFVHAKIIDQHLSIKVKDNGPGIPKDRIEQVFDRYESAANQQYLGTGIGLAFTKELVNVLSGQISVKNNVDQGACFEVSLPLKAINNTATQTKSSEKIILPVYPLSGNNNLSIKQSSMSSVADENNDKPLVLIIEDHPEVAFFISKCLGKSYQQIICHDGKKGVEQAFEQVPDLIISDVMMPFKNGLEVCQELKTDSRTSHIPIILLTAKADLEDKLKGLEFGADAYLAKPFNEKELSLWVDNLLKQRKTIQDYYQNLLDGKKTAIVEKPLATQQMEDDFLAQAKEIVLSHLSDADFDVKAFCKGIAMSRTQLHRKLTAITGLSTTGFIHTIRIEVARQMLNDEDLSISEIAYDTGFSDPNYFARIFNKMEGCTPSEYRKKVL